LRTEQLSRRIADAPRGVVMALVALSVAISPGYVRHSASDGAALAPARDAGSFGQRDVAVLELTCRSGVFTAPCLQFTARVSEALASHPRVTGEVRSLVGERIVRAEHGVLRLDPLLPPPLAGEARLRVLAARVRADETRQRRFLAPDERATFVYAALEPGSSARDSSALVESIRTRLDPSPDLGLTLRGVGPDEPARGGLALAALAFALAAFALAPGSWRAALLASLGALAFTAFGHGLLGLVGESEGARVGFAPELLAASAFAAGLALMARARAEQRLERQLRASVAAALAAVGPALAVVALLCASGLAARLALAPPALGPRGLGAASGIAVGLVAYPLGIVLAGLLAWPQVLRGSRSKWGGRLARRVERACTRPKVVAVVAMAAVAITAGALALLRVEPGAAHLRTVVLDAGSDGGALEPAFLERVQGFQRELERGPGVVWSSSFVDAVAVPANRALHDGDPVFATVPLTREDVVQALHPWLQDDRAAPDLQVDAKRRRVAVDWLVVPNAAGPTPVFGRPLASTALALFLVGAIAAALLRSARGGALCALPAGIVSVVVFVLARTFVGGSGGAGVALAPLAAGVSAALGMQLLVRTRALLAERAQLEVALSLALRETGPAIASASLGSSALIALAGVGSGSDPAVVALACAVPALAAACALAIVPQLVRVTRGGFFTTRVILHSRVSQTQG